MERCDEIMYRSETIAAISTAMSNSGIGIVRISGDDAIEIADKIFMPVKKNEKYKKGCNSYGSLWKYR